MPRRGIRALVTVRHLPLAACILWSQLFWRSLDYGLAGLAGPSTIDPSAATEIEPATRVGGGRPRLGRGGPAV